MTATCTLIHGVLTDGFNPLEERAFESLGDFTRAAQEAAQRRDRDVFWRSPEVAQCDHCGEWHLVSSGLSVDRWNFCCHECQYAFDDAPDVWGERILDAFLKDRDPPPEDQWAHEFPF